MAQTVGTGVLAEDTGETPRTIQHWSDLGILEPLPSTHKQGRGFHREFNAHPPYYGERALALVAGALNRQRIPLVNVKTIVQAFRNKAPNPDVREAIARALKGDLELVFIRIDEGRTLIKTQLVSTQPSDEAKADPRNAMFNSNLRLQLFYRDIYDTEGGLLLNLTKALEPLRRTL